MIVKMLKVTPNGNNAKLGPGVGTTYRPVGITCPNSCPLLGNGCYAQRGHVAIQQSRSKHDNHDLMKLAANRLVRHLVSGDWMQATKTGRKVLDRVFVRAVIALHRQCPWLTGWGYTHDATEFDRAKITPDTFPPNLHILASCDTAEEKQRHNANGWRTARVIAERADKTEDEFLCPVDLQKRLGVPAEDRTNCARCQACFATNKNIAFLKF
jgi:hypothetical protein